jgi:GNAT superfamily N-acetyltransferase
LRAATLQDLDVLVRHRRGMWDEISDLTAEELDSADRVYRRWARTRMKSGSLVGFVVETSRHEPAASGCLWLMPMQPRPRSKGTVVPYLMSMYTEPAHRGNRLATRIVREAVRWSKDHGYSVVFLHASPHGAGLYTRAGFRRTREMILRLVPASRRTKKGPRRSAGR